MDEESRFRRCVSLLESTAQQVAEIDGLVPGGALLGPRLFLLAACGETADAERLVKVGAAVELLRRAALTHRQPVVEDHWEGYGETRFSRTLRGDMLLAKAFKLLAENGEPRLVSVLSEAMSTVAESELVTPTADGRVPDAKWRASAEYYVGAARVGAIVGGLSEPNARNLEDLGRAIGEARERADACGTVTEPVPLAGLPEVFANWLEEGIRLSDSAR